MNERNQDTRQERRERKLFKRRQRMPKHGLTLGHVYRNAVVKRAATLAERARKREAQRSHD